MNHKENEMEKSKITPLVKWKRKKSAPPFTSYSELGLRQAKEMYATYKRGRKTPYDVFLKNALGIGCVLYVIDGKDWLLHPDAPEPTGLKYELKSSFKWPLERGQSGLLFSADTSELKVNSDELPF